ncbi:MAG: aspartyl/glutamyl-tRNA amidotransferase subunit C, partial [Desulfitobacterium sp.]|nr:aspartyl/glutamyl-tRNA amidotransferase subunit C [Desulfitobacterium sp.]
MSLSQKELEHLAGLARIELSEENLSTYLEQLNSILEYVEP